MSQNAHFRRELRREQERTEHGGNTKQSVSDKYIFEVLTVNEIIVNWDLVPDVINKDQLYRICHISKTTAMYLLRSGKIPCSYTGKKTRCYNIKKEDVKAYLEDRVVFPEAYSAPVGWYSGKHSLPKIKLEMPEPIYEDMHEYYAELLKNYKDVISSGDIVKLTGYSKSAINGWCAKGHLKAFQKRNVYVVPKVILVDYFCSQYFRTIIRKTDWHIRVLKCFPAWNRRHNQIK